jgi:hypothetical protein
VIAAVDTGIGVPSHKVTGIRPLVAFAVILPNCQIPAEGGDRMTQTDKQASNRFKVTVDISRPPVEIGTRHIHINNHEGYGFEIGKFGPAEMELVIHDSEVIKLLLRNRTTEMTEIVNNVLTGRMEAAVRLASRIGLTEEAFQRRGGGPIFWVYIAIAAGAVMANVVTTGGDGGDDGDGEDGGAPPGEGGAPPGGDGEE